ncbi:hypothetical protein Q428_12330 [Fervidicella metallireducens AeB]|uniref:Uncharacterized protein n=1 Tax=Fervidicella metallireducens AeB TaxID=1403537 RepID=A0A017RSK4_9CLOT|nr:hypothetical protein [Fervidicella metallireducens]EYE87617.1 hypothetical protein Q428_12330 [Fervidicella metallireducens AeB]
MSRKASYNYNLQKQIRRELENERIRLNTQRFYNRYLQQYEDMINRGFIDILPKELSNINNMLNEIKNNLDSDVTLARDISYQLGAYINEVWSLGNVLSKRLAQEFKTKIIEIKQNRKTMKEAEDKLDIFMKLVSEIKDPLIMDFAYDELQNLKRKIELNSEQIALTEIKSEINKIIEIATNKAEMWKENKKKDMQNEIQLKTISEIEQHFKEDLNENPKEIENILNSINDIKSELIKGNKIDGKNFNEIMRKEIEDVNTVVLNETIRKEMVKRIIKSLKHSGFVVSNPKIIEENGEKIVKVIAKKPSGNTAICSVKIDGEFTYSFDNYEGQACKNDIKIFEQDLKKIYGVELSNERVIWENPDRISATAKPIDNNFMNKG